MGRNPTGRRKYQIESLWNSHHEVMRLLLLGWKSKDVAEHLGVTEAMVSYTKNSALVQRQLAIMQGARDAEVLDCAIEIKKRVGKALEVLDDTLSLDAQPALRFRAAEAVLDREAPKINRFEGTVAKLTAADLTALKERALSVAREAGLVVDVTPTLATEGSREVLVAPPANDA